MTWVLVINQNQEMLDFLTGAVSSVLLPEAPCLAAQNLARAQAHMVDWGTRACALIVCSPTAPPDASQAPELDGRSLHGVDFIQELRQRLGNEPPVIFIAAFADTERAAEIARVPNAHCIGTNDLYQQLRAEVERAVPRLVLSRTAVSEREEPPPPQSRAVERSPATCHVDLDIVLRAGQQCTWSIRGSEMPVEDTGVMDIKSEEIEKLMALSRPAGSADADFLRTLGVDLYRTLMQDSIKSDGLEIALNVSVTPLGGMEFARIRFNVDEKTHRILLETLAKPDRGATPQFWMLRSPMFRKLGGRGTRHALFQNPGTRDAPVDCLLIQGRVDRFAAGKPFQRYFSPVPNAQKEISWLEDYLKDNRTDFGIGTVEVLRYGEHAGTFAQAVEEKLREHKFELVHYAGHSALDDDEQPWLVFGGEPDDTVDLSLFAQWARPAQFVFLSSCESADSRFIMELVQREVPAVIGYAWEVQDTVAVEFAQAFYAKLLGGGRDKRLLEYSFMAAKQSLHRSYPKKAHWAAPLLFMQVFDTPAAALPR